MNSILLAVVIPSTLMGWIPHTSSLTEKAEEFIASVKKTNLTSEEFYDENLADMIKTYTDAPVYDYCSNGEVTKYKQIAQNGYLYTKIDELANDLNSLVLCVNRIETILNNYLDIDNTYYLKNKAVIDSSCGYIRSINSNYCYLNFKFDGLHLFDEIAWNTICGGFEFYEGTIDEVEKNYSIGASPLNFFARYINEDLFNSTDHVKPVGRFNGWGTTCDSNFHAPYWDGNIDLIHMFAAIDAGLDFTNGGNPSSNSSTINIEKDIGGWGGDLQCLINNLCSNNNTQTIISAQNFKDLKPENNKFGEADFYADVDAANIVDLLSPSSAYDLSYTIKEYYGISPFYGMQRITSFIRNVADEPSINWSDTNDIYELFRREAHFLLCRQWKDGKYIDANTNSPYFGVMTSGLPEIPSADLRDKVADLFADYVINLSKGEK